MVEGKILITGISGMIGGLLAKQILESTGYNNGKTEIFGVCRNKRKAECNLGDDVIRKISLYEEDVTCSEWMEKIDSLDYIIHCAAVTDSKKMVETPVEVADGITVGTRNILQLAKKCSVKSMVFISSMEVYGVVDDIGRARSEEELGMLDLENVRNCYPMAKRMAEHYCHLFWNEYSVPVKIARLSQTFGKGVRADDNRVYMQFAKSLCDSKDIELHTEGNSWGNYCSTEDAVGAIFKILEDGENGEVYNVVNEENTMSIKEMAHIVADEVANGSIGVKMCVDTNLNSIYACDTALRLSSNKMKGLGWSPNKGIRDMYYDVINQIQN